MRCEGPFKIVKNSLKLSFCEELFESELQFLKVKGFTDHCIIETLMPEKTYLHKDEVI